MPARKSGFDGGLDRGPRVCICHVKKYRKHAKRLARSLRQKLGGAASVHECARKDGELDDEVYAQLSRADVFIPMFPDNVEHSALLVRATNHALERGLPVVAIATGALPEGIAPRVHTVVVNGSVSEVEGLLSTIDLGEFLSRDRGTDRPAEALQELDTPPAGPRPQTGEAPTARVAAIVHRSHLGDDGILLMRRQVAPFEGKWSLPDAEIGRFESSRDAVVRAVKEQCGLEFEASLLTCVDEILPRDGRHCVIVGFVGAGVGEADVDVSEVAETAWQPVWEAVTVNLVPSHRELLQAFADGV